MNTNFFTVVLVVLLQVPIAGCTQKSGRGALLKADREFSFPAGFVTDPKEDGKRTLSGVDADGDGLRDDVQRWTYARYPRDPRKRGVLQQLAKVYQNWIRPDFIGSRANEVLVQLDRALPCLTEVFPDLAEQDAEMKMVKTKVLNTVERSRQFFRFDRQFSGKMIGDTYKKDGTACDVR